jgi:eukaryotic-like serine/threonine-protein kinase
MGVTRPARLVRFASFQLDVRAGELYRNGIRVRLPSQSIHVLAMLLEHPGEVVTREELRQRLWPNGTIVEFDHGINAVINRLRQALEDSADEPRFIETLPRRGYRFLVPVEFAESAEPGGAGAPAADRFEAGTLLGPYQIVSALGAGGMGEVYRARDTRLERTVAIKVLPEHSSTSALHRELFEREARAISSLSHPHICALYDIGQQDGVEYLVMEYLEGETLAHRLRKGPLPLDEVFQISIQMADALDTAHKHGVIHRDLKPGNIMLTKTGVKLLDFGLAKVQMAEPARGVAALSILTTPLTSEGGILGTLQYMAPEQLEGKEADARTDLFALGTVIYEMATGRSAFEGKSEASLISNIMTAQPPRLSILQPLATPLLEHVVDKCLAKVPEDRWQIARDLETELQWIAAAGSASELSATTPTRARKRERFAWGAAGGLVLAVIALLTIVYLRPTSEARVVQFEVSLGDKATSEWPTISPDGQYLAFGASDSPISASKIWLRPLSSFDTNPLPLTEGAMPFWSPDAREIAFSTSTALKKISLSGGTSQTICNLPAFGSGAWNRDGVIIFASGFHHPLYRVNAMGGEPKALTSLDRSRQEQLHIFPQFLPDGEHFIYLSESAKPENSGTYLGSLDSPKRKRIHDGLANAVYAPPGYLIFRTGTSLMARRFDFRRAEVSGDPLRLVDGVATGNPPFYSIFSVSENGILAYLSLSMLFDITELVWCDRTGRRLGTVASPAAYSNPAISPDHKKIAVAKWDTQTNTRDIWIIDFERRNSSRLTFDPADDTNPTWSPDGTRIAFSSNRKGHFDIYVKPASGVGDEHLERVNTLKTGPVMASTWHMARIQASGSIRLSNKSPCFYFAAVSKIKYDFSPNAQARSAGSPTSQTRLDNFKFTFAALPAHSPVREANGKFHSMAAASPTGASTEKSSFMCRATSSWRLRSTLVRNPFKWELLKSCLRADCRGSEKTATMSRQMADASL